MTDYELPGEDWADLPTVECLCCQDDEPWETLELWSLSFATIFAAVLVTLAVWG
jgi:hypothetical protein